MEQQEIRKLAELMREMDLSLLELTEGDFSLRMERGARQASAPGSGPAPAASAAETVPEPPAVRTENADGDYTVTSPMIGVFYTAPSPEAKAYVSVGDTVRAGDVLCVIEAMKMMNEITADAGGVVTEICAANKQVVEYGHPLFRLRKSTVADV